MARYKNKKLNKELPGGRYLIMDKDGNTEEVRSCYDPPVRLPKWDNDDDDEDASDCDDDRERLSKRRNSLARKRNER